MDSSLGEANGPSEGWTVSITDCLSIKAPVQGVVALGTLKHVSDHALESHPATVLWGVDPLDTVSMKGTNLIRNDDAAPAAEDLDVVAPILIEEGHHVSEEFVVSALVGAHSDGVRVLLDASLDDVSHRAVVAQVNDLSTELL